MITYITGFIFYTLAMIGVLLIGFLIYKNTMMTTKRPYRGSMKVIDSLPIAPKKTLLVVKVKNEKFLIASGAEHTTFLSKLEPDNTVDIDEQQIESKTLYTDTGRKEAQLMRNRNRKEMIKQLMKDFDEPKIEGRF